MPAELWFTRYTPAPALCPDGRVLMELPSGSAGRGHRGLPSSAHKDRPRLRAIAWPQSFVAGSCRCTGLGEEFSHRIYCLPRSAVPQSVLLDHSGPSGPLIAASPQTSAKMQWDKSVCVKQAFHGSACASHPRQELCAHRCTHALCSARGGSHVRHSLVGDASEDNVVQEGDLLCQLHG